MAVNKKNIISRILLIFLILMFSIFVYFITPQFIVDKIGITNGYIISFITGLLGGVSIFFPFPYYLFVLAFAAAGLNPIILGIATGVGVTIGESTSYLLGYSGREIMPTKWHKKAEKFCDWCMKKPPWMIPIIFFLYGCFIPLPNDFITIPMGIAKYPYTRSILPLGLGNIVFNIILAYSSLFGLNLIL